MEKAELKNSVPSYTAPRGKFSLVTVPRLQYLMIDGHGDPNSSQGYQDALKTIYPVAYALKFFSKKELDRDYGVMPLEGLWWADDMESFTSARDKSRWSWTALNLVPDWIGQDHLERILEVVAAKGEAPSLDALRLEPLEEGLCVQTLHIGPYDAEGPVLESMHNGFIPENSLTMTGKHHEIYLSDARRTAPEKLKTILRQPVIPAAGQLPRNPVVPGE
ncbi:GyrI-like domain-containing protein [Paenarthrobacter sp. NCHU4564]|uniref:GyrI-like domain-containing protein n=1 Tax=Paenarthrobacter sp. NCHU4564 TaxID=3451353 RepID=UPI003F9E7F71